MENILNTLITFMENLHLNVLLNFNIYITAISFYNRELGEFSFGKPHDNIFKTYCI
jgi:hypothetical protein